jgi:hypothetical protein
MPAKRRKFSPQYKAEAVQMVVQTGRTVAEFGASLRGGDAWMAGSVGSAWRRVSGSEQALLERVQGRSGPDERQ